MSWHEPQTKTLPLLAVTAALVFCPAGRSVPSEGVIPATGVAGGLVVHLGCDDGKLTAQLRAGPGYLVHGLDTDPAQVAEARHYLRSLGVYGPVAVDQFDGHRLPYRDHLVNLLVVSERFNVSEREMFRVLAPRGVAYIHRHDGWRKRTKPWPTAMDEWTHYLHGPDNNAVARDALVGPPRQMQWVAAPAWTRNHHKLNSVSAVVTAGGRLFAILDEATAANITLPSKWVLVARDAFSGVTLWRKPLASWADHQIRFRSGPPQLPRLLVATADRVYAPLGLSEPVSVTDAASGKTLRTFEQTAGAEEIVLAGDTLLVLQGSPVAEQAVRHPAFSQRYRLPNRKAVLAVDTSSGQTKWRWSDDEADIMPETLASDGSRVYFQIGQGVVCLDGQSGNEIWSYGRGESRAARKRVTFGTNTLVVADGVVLAKRSGQLTALAAETGQKLWECPAGGGFHAPLDVFVIDGLVWKGDHVQDSVAPPPAGDFHEGRDLRTGEVRRRNQVAVDLQTAGHHHRCYREKATERFIIMGKRGMELMDLAGQEHSRNNWVRGTCQYGILPANGLLYAPPHSCGCYMESKLWGFWALAPDRPRRSTPASLGAAAGRTGPGASPAEAEDTVRRQVFARPEEFPPEAAASPEDWPQYRHDPLRSGTATTVLPTRFHTAWQTKLEGRLTQPVVAAGKVVIASVDEHTVYALDAETGRVSWTHVAGGRIDSPPAIHQGLVLFGSADGRVTCLRLDDGSPLWRFLAAPTDLRAVAYDQVESVWPVHGSVLLLDGVAYCSAGRSTWLDGGIHLWALDPATGQVREHAHFQSKHPEFQEGKEQARPEHNTRVDQNTTDYKTFLASDRSDAFSMAGGAVDDVLVSDGRNIFLHHVKFNAQLQRQETMSRHLFSTSSLLDETENHRSHWVLGTGDFSRIPVAYSWIANRPGRRVPTIAVPAGVMLAFDDHAVWGVRRQGDANGRYYLFKKENRPFSEQEEPLPDFRRISPEEATRNVWQVEFPARPRAMLKSGDHLYLGGTPVEIPEDDPHAAYEGRLGGSIRVVAERDGSKVAEHPLESPVVWDGMAAARGRLFVAARDGTVLCLRGGP